MRLPVGCVIAIFVAASFMQAQAQDAATVEQRTEALRAQLREVTDKQAQLQAREQQLDEELKPENIEHSLSGVGTTDATALRDQRRQQLEKEKANVEGQLQGLAESRSRLESAISTAEAEAVRLRAASLNTNSAPHRTGAAEAGKPSAVQRKPSARRAVKRRRKRTRRRAQ
jgi:chromosome segregation ATPase